MKGRGALFGFGDEIWYGVPVITDVSLLTHPRQLAMYMDDARCVFGVFSTYESA